MEMAVCDGYGIPHSHFLGGPNRWTQPDRDKAIWWYLRKQEQCGECGTRRSEWDEWEKARKVQRDVQPPYGAKKVRCRGCEAKQRGEASITKADGRGVHIEMHRLG